MFPFRRSFQSQDELLLMLNPGVSERQELADRRLRGLMLIKRKNGLPKWVLKYQCPRTFQKRSCVLGAFAQLSLNEARQRGMEVIREEYGSDQFELISWPVQSSGADADSMTSRATDPSLAPLLAPSLTPSLPPTSEPKPAPSSVSAPKSTALGRGLDASIGADRTISSMKLEASHPSSAQIAAPLLLPTTLPAALISQQLRAFITLQQFYLDHYLPYIKVAKRSWATDVSVLSNHILPSLGGYAMVDFKPFMVQEMVQVLVRKGLSPSTCNRALIILRFMFNCGLKWAVLPKIENPCQAVKELTLNNKKERFLNGSEISILKRELAKSRNRFLPYIVQLLILTGCRRGEALNAQIQHFDLGRGDWVVPLPKAGKARHIPLNDMAIQTVRAAIQMKQTHNQVTKESPYLFPSPSTGEPFQSIFYAWDKARKAAHIDTVRMHDLRHSFASAMVNSGMTLYDVKQILGHSNIRTTERYSHLSNSRLRQAAESVTTFYDNQEWIK